MCHHSNPVQDKRAHASPQLTRCLGSWISLTTKMGLAKNVYCCGKNSTIKGLITRLANVFFQLSRLWLISATLLLSRDISHHTTGQHQVSPWHAELWVELARSDTSGVLHAVTASYLMALTLIAMEQFPEFKTFCAYVMLGPTLARPLTVMDSVRVPLLRWVL